MKTMGIMNLLKQAQEVQEEMARVKQELAGKRVTGSAGGGMVEVTANGKQHIVNIKIDPDAIKLNDKEMLEDMIAAATNQALERAQQLADEEMSKITGGLLGNLPEGLKIPGLNL